MDKLLTIALASAALLSVVYAFATATTVLRDRDLPEDSLQLLGLSLAVSMIAVLAGLILKAEAIEVAEYVAVAAICGAASAACAAFGRSGLRGNLQPVLAVLSIGYAAVLPFVAALSRLP